MCDEHIDGALDGQAAVGRGFEFKETDAGFFVHEEKDLGMNSKTPDVARIADRLFMDSHSELPLFGPRKCNTLRAAMLKWRCIHKMQSLMRWLPEGDYIGSEAAD